MDPHLSVSIRLFEGLCHDTTDSTRSGNLQNHGIPHPGLIPHRSAVSLDQPEQSQQWHLNGRDRKIEVTRNFGELTPCTHRHLIVRYFFCRAPISESSELLCASRFPVFWFILVPWRPVQRWATESSLRRLSSRSSLRKPMRELRRLAFLSRCWR